MGGGSFKTSILKGLAPEDHWERCQLGSDRSHVYIVLTKLQSDIYSNIENVIFLDKGDYLLLARLLTQNRSSLLLSWASPKLRK